MLFSSLVFLYAFLPLVLLGYYVSPAPIKNYWLLVLSLAFFAWGGVSFTALLVTSILFNYLFGICIQNNRESKSGFHWLVAGVAFNLALLSVYKYANFFVENLNVVFRTTFDDPGIILPVGISFYTFHSLSYLVDIYRKKVEAQRNIFDLALYIAMFSQLIAGPIIRYSDVWQQLKQREHSLLKFGSGVERFLIGMGKKVLLANTFAQVADALFDKNPNELTAPLAWLGMASYSLQIYCDFAGYSDMAIGLGRMFGFDFKENFDYPYTARSVKEFWRRWHLSLSGFFRDYVYIPLGGNQKGTVRTYLNLLAVFFLTGIWHGANWTFVIWGLFHGAFMLIERAGLDRLLEKLPAFFSRLYTLLVVMMAWVLFRATSFDQAVGFWKSLFNFNYTPMDLSATLLYLNKELVGVFAIAVAGAFGWLKWVQPLKTWMYQSSTRLAKFVSPLWMCSEWIFYAGILFLATLYLAAGTYNPFIYYRF